MNTKLRCVLDESKAFVYDLRYKEVCKIYKGYSYIRKVAPILNLTSGEFGLNINYKEHAI